MTDHSVTHATFTIERTYPVAPGDVFAAWSDQAIKSRWFAGGSGNHTMDFRVGGRETAGGTANGKTMLFETSYQEIVPDTRIVYTSTMSSDGAVVTVSLTSVEFTPVDGGTRLDLTEHGAYLDGHEQPSWREEGTNSQLDAMEKLLHH